MFIYDISTKLGALKNAFKIIFDIDYASGNSPFPLPLNFSNWTPLKGYYKKGFLSFL